MTKTCMVTSTTNSAAVQSDMNKNRMSLLPKRQAYLQARISAHFPREGLQEGGLAGTRRTQQQSQAALQRDTENGK